MKLIPLLILAAIVAALIAFAVCKGKNTGADCAVNANWSGVPTEHVISLKPDAAHAAGVFVKAGSDDDHYDVCGAGDIPLGFVEDSSSADEVTAGHAKAVCLPNFRRPVMVTASEAITQSDELYPAASGQVQDKPGSSTHYCCAKPIAAIASGKQGPAYLVYPRKDVIS